MLKSRTGLLLALLGLCGALFGAREVRADGAHHHLTTASVAPVIEAYERVRVRLVQDDLRGALKAAPGLQAAAEALAKGQHGALKRDTTALVGAAKKLKAAKPADAAAVRAAFGEVSRALIALLAANPAAREGLQIFQCPMAKGFKKWIQRDAKLANPYMGASMPGCGARADWS